MNILNRWQRNNRYKDLVYQGEDRLFDSSDIPRVYVLVRDDILTPIAQGIQAAHAIAHLSASLSGNPERLFEIANSYLILLGAPEQEIKKWAKKKTPFHATFVDTGLVDNGFPVLTAIAFVPMLRSEGEKLFGHLRRAE